MRLSSARGLLALLAVLLYSTGAAAAEENEDNCLVIERYLSWSCAERFRALRVCLVPRGDGASILAAATAMLEKRESTCKTVCTLQLRTQFAKNRATASKRKRVVMAAASDESADDSGSD